jgi:2,4-dienoyl-CoA reductase (NADPH2)
LVYRKAQQPKKVAVVGAGPAGLSAATVAAECGHDVTLFDSSDRIGGQFNLAMQVPGKEEFAQTLRYFSRRLAVTGVKLQLQTRVTREQLLSQGFDEVVVATGIVPRTPRITGVERTNVVSYIDVLQRKVTVGKRVAIIGPGAWLRCG